MNLALRLVLPAALVLVVSYLLPMLGLARMAFNRTLTGGAIEEGTWTLANFAEILTDTYFLELTRNSIQLSVTATTAAAILAYPVALFLYRTTSRWRTLLAVIAIAPLLVNGVVRVFGWLVVLGDNGVINNSLAGLNALAGVTLFSAPIRMVHNWTGVTIGLTESIMPYMILGLLAGLGRLDRNLEEAAMSLGARPARVFWRVTLPLSMPAIVLAWLLGFVLSMSAFVTPKLLGGGRVFVLATEIFDLARESVIWTMAAALALYTLVLLALFLAAYGVLSRRLMR